MLKYWILKLLSNKPMNGAELIKEVNTRSGGHWKPSPGSIYPALSSLERNGLIKKNEEGRYLITAKGEETRNGMTDILENFNDREEEDDIIEGTVANLRYIREGIEDRSIQRSKTKVLEEECKNLLEAIKNE
ncbi:PadR family transcriptional regulator [Cuniculiplasma sp. SKW4]|uniref:PadR family transcriptional regulator n=1 Tax=Cuniculiplasma sp. SKW4 TaxID=3400171 RepID=UPI003FCFC4BE